MGWDPETGMWEPDVFRQPLGALGAVMNFGNARRATEISDEKQRARSLAADLEQSRLDSEQFDLENERAAREEIDRTPNATPEQVADIYARRNPKSGLGWAKAGARAAATTSAAETAAGAKRDVANINQGATGAPKPTAEAHAAEAKATNLETQTALLPDESAAKIALANARAELTRMMTRLRQKVGLGGKVGKDERAAIGKKITSMIAQRDAVENRADPLTGMKRTMNPQLQEELDAMDEAIATAIESLRDAGRAPTAAGGEPKPAGKKSPEQEAADAGF